MRYHKGSDHHHFSTMKDFNKEFPCGGTRKVRILVQEETLEAREDLLTSTKIPSQLNTKLYNIYIELVLSDIMR